MNNKIQTSKLDAKFEEIQSFIQNEPKSRPTNETFSKATGYYRLVLLISHQETCQSKWKDLKKELEDFFAQRALYFKGYLMSFDVWDHKDVWYELHNALTVARRISSKPCYSLCVTFESIIKELEKLERKSF